VLFTALPLAVGVQLGLHAAQAEGTDRWALGLTGATAGLVPLLARAPLPPDATDAVLLALVGVAAFWAIATRTVRAVAT